jgi:protein-disulfide isomerase
MREESESPALSPPVSDERDHIHGPHSAPVTLVEYGDYECPYCGEAHLILQKLVAHFGEKMRFVFRNFPLTQMHPHALGAAEAAEAASVQGRFWEMHDVLYERQDGLEENDLVSYAAELQLDVARFQNDLSQGVYRDRIQEDFMSGVRSGVNGTPTLFINGRRYEGPVELHSLTDAVNQSAAPHHEGASQRHHRPHL